MSAALTMARHYGLKKLAAPSAGNAGGALAAYAAAAGLEAYIFMPKDVPLANRLEVEASGAHLTLVDGLISDCGRMVAERKEKEGWFDVSTLKEPFRVEGKKTMGYEVAEQLGWTLPDAILYPTGGGVGLIGMWKAFEEMEELGWIEAGKRPKMICVQATAARLFPKRYKRTSGRPNHGRTRTPWLRDCACPRLMATSSFSISFGRVAAPRCRHRRRNHAGRERDGIATEGIFAAPEGAAALAAYQQLLASGFLKSSDKVVLFNTGIGLQVPGRVRRLLGRGARWQNGQASRIAQYGRDHRAVLGPQRTRTVLCRDCARIAAKINATGLPPVFSVLSDGESIPEAPADNQRLSTSRLHRVPAL